MDINNLNVFNVICNIGLTEQEFEDIVKSEVQRAISADEEAMARLCANYIDNIKAYTQKESEWVQAKAKIRISITWNPKT